MLFGRRKPGFTKLKSLEDEKENKIEENKKLKKDKSLKEDKDLLDVELSEEEIEELKKETIEELNEEKEDEEEVDRVLLLADFIRKRSIAGELTSISNLKKDDEDIEDLLAEIKKLDEYGDIVESKGDKDIYYYSSNYMSHNYSQIAILIEEKDLAKTISELVRWNCETYPCATPIYYFKNPPYNYTSEQIEQTLKKIYNSEKYSDIRELKTGNNMRYLYSTIHMSEKYARALAEGVEYGEYGYTQFNKN